MNPKQYPVINYNPSPDAAVSVAAMREADRRTIEGGTPSVELMRRAAQGVFEACDGWDGKAVLILCGGGNNGGDGYALAEILHDHDITVALYPASEKRSEDGAYYYQKCVEKGIPMLSGPDYARFDVYVDCLLGTGFQGTPREPIASVIRELNRTRAKSPDKCVISVDINSGMNGDTGEGELAVIHRLGEAGAGSAAGAEQNRAAGQRGHWDSDGRLRMKKRNRR